MAEFSIVRPPSGPELDVISDGSHVMRLKLPKGPELAKLVEPLLAEETVWRHPRVIEAARCVVGEADKGVRELVAKIDEENRPKLDAAVRGWYGADELTIVAQHYSAKDGALLVVVSVGHELFDLCRAFMIGDAGEVSIDLQNASIGEVLRALMGRIQ